MSSVEKLDTYIGQSVRGIPVIQFTHHAPFVIWRPIDDDAYFSETLLCYDLHWTQAVQCMHAEALLICWFTLLWLRIENFGQTCDSCNVYIVTFSVHLLRFATVFNLFGSHSCISYSALTDTGNLHLQWLHKIAENWCVWFWNLWLFSFRDFWGFTRRDLWC